MTSIERLQTAGIRRFGSPKSGFRWKGASKRDLDRLEGLKIPPAWTDVAVSRSPQSRLQAVGRRAQSVLRIFTKLREIRFPIAKARLTNHYDGNDDASIADNNTSAFNSRNVAGTWTAPAVAHVGADLAGWWLL